MTVLRLSFVPLAPKESLHIYLNGVEQFQDTDWAYDATGNKINCLSPMDARAGDLLEARYAHLGVQPDVIPPSVIDCRNGIAVNPVVSGLTAAAAGDTILMIVGVQSGGGTISTPAGATQLGSDITAFNWLFRIFTKTAAGGETSFAFTASGPTGFGSTIQNRVVAVVMLLRDAVIASTSSITHAGGTPQPIPVGSGYVAGDIAVAVACTEHGVVDGNAGTAPAPYTTVIRACENAAPTGGGNGKGSIAIATWVSAGTDNPTASWSFAGSTNNVDIRTFRVTSP